MFAKTLRVVGGVSIISRAVVASNRAVNAFGRDTMAPFATLGSVLEANAATRGNREAYKAVQQDVAWDFAELKNRVDSFARGLLLNGYKKGSKLAVWMSNETEHLVVQLAAARIGVTVISIDPSVGVKGVESVLKAENCRGLVFSERYNGEHRAAALHAAIPEIDATLPGQTFASKRIRSMRHVVSTGFDEFEGMNYYREFPMAGDLQSFDAAVAAVSDADVALIQYVPATNADGVSRGKEFTQKQLVDEASKSAASLKLSTDDVVCLTAPLHTVAGFAQGAVAAAVAGAKVVVPTKEFNSDEAVRATTDYFVTTLVATKDQAAAITAGVPSKSFKAAVA